MSSHLTPLEVCEFLIGPLPQLGLIAGRNDKAAYAWRRGSEWRAPGDMPPSVNRALLAHAEKHGIPLKARDLIFGADRAKVAARLATVRTPEAAE
ncbi:hypothetical protein [Oceaniglobus trochenteri]|uniref:hypothetical protein n=1 Tax=Oceaniglobus trochenteri TaxID=2763260 RepID=UPI001D0017F3|nr:hypothetical protein [Oceaniglobus trochenteri]